MDTKREIKFYDENGSLQSSIVDITQLIQIDSATIQSRISLLPNHIMMVGNMRTKAKIYERRMYIKYFEHYMASCARNGLKPVKTDFEKFKCFDCAEYVEAFDNKKWMGYAYEALMVAKDMLQTYSANSRNALQYVDQIKSIVTEPEEASSNPFPAHTRNKKAPTVPRRKS